MRISGELMVVLIVAIVMIASIFKAKYGYGRHRRRGEHEPISAQEHAENLRLRDEVKELKERIKVLERITVDQENSLAKQIDELRDR
ncbi:MAG TPA: hypothetical protein VJM15_07855 [Sphingomicrobium sp.]|nr:hypothetical protein [Sphingomicrobium sp.]